MRTTTKKDRRPKSPKKIGPKLNRAYRKPWDSQVRYLVLKGGAGCFVASTPVYTETGYMPISEIEPGQKVLSFSHKTNSYEFRPVLLKFRYEPFEIRQNTLTFVLSTGERFTCTENHEFYDGAHYVPARVIAKRAMERGCRDGREVLHLDRGSFAHRGMEGNGPDKGNETGPGFKWLSPNHDNPARQNQDNKAAPYSCPGLCGKSERLNGGEPQGRHKVKQQAGQPGMGYEVAEYATQFPSWPANEYWGAKRLQQTHRSAGKGNTGEIQAAQIWQESPGDGVRGFPGHDKRHNSGQVLEASLIAEIHYAPLNEPVFDLCVDVNHNYTVGEGRYHVHNSGKSVFCAQKLLHRCKSEHNNYTFAHRFLVIRKVAATRKDSVFNLIQGEINRQGIQNEWRVYSGDLRFVHLKTGAEIITKGIDDPEKMKSVADITGIWIEEATELLVTDFTQLDLRLRGDYPYYKQIIFSFNPIASTHWLAKLFDTAGSKYAVKSELYHTNYLHNRFIDAEYKEALENLVAVDVNLARIYLEGEWGIEDPNKLFAKDFKREKHVSKKARYDHTIGQVWLSFDFNVVNTCGLWQYDEGRVYCFREYRYDSGDLQDLCFDIKAFLKEIKMKRLAKYGGDYYPDYLIVNGDASGGNRSGLTVGRQTAYEQLAHFLSWDGRPLDWDHFRVPDANPGHGASRLLTNMVLKNETEFLIHPSCTNLINDLENVKFEKGQIDKKDETLTHSLDQLRYFIWAQLQDRMKRYGLGVIQEKLVRHN